MIAFLLNRKEMMVSHRFRVGVGTSGVWYRRYRTHGETAARKRGQPPGSKLDAHEAFILDLVEQTPDISLQEIAGRLRAERTVSAGPSTVREFFKKRGICERTATPGREGGTGSLVYGPGPKGLLAHANLESNPAQN
jgi:hypothetical protein